MNNKEISDPPLLIGIFFSGVIGLVSGALLQYFFSNPSTSIQPKEPQAQVQRYCEGTNYTLVNNTLRGEDNSVLYANGDCVVYAIQLGGNKICVKDDKIKVYSFNNSGEPTSYLEGKLGDEELRDATTSFYKHRYLLQRAGLMSKEEEKPWCE